MINNRYELKEELGRGGFAVTYKGIDHLLHRYVAIKESEISLEHEAKIMKELKNVPYVSHIYDYFKWNKKEYIVMRLIPGKSLTAYLSEKEKIYASDLKVWLPSLLLALGQMHRLSIIHRDISPGNLMITEDLTLYLIDFGTATSMKHSFLKNKQVFVHKGLDSPEYLRNELQGPWTDIYSLCATIVYLISGEGIPLAVDRVKYDLVPERLMRLSLSKKQQNTIMKGLRIDIKDRYQDINTFSRDLLNVDYVSDMEEADPYHVSYYAKTDIGTRKVNQDNFMVDRQFRYANEDCEIMGDILCYWNEIHVAALADGVYSASHSELASMAVAQAASHFVRAFQRSEALPQRLLEDFLDHLNEKIISLGRKIGKTASTIAIILWKGDKYYVATIGDSSVYLYHKNKMKKLTTAHTKINEKLVKGESVSAEDLHVLSRYVGKKGIIGSQMADYSMGTIEKGDTFLICTDGISDKISQEKMGKILKKNGNEILKKLWKPVKKNPSMDNCTAIVLKFGA